MNKKYSILSVGIMLSLIFTVVVLSGFLDDEGMVLEQDKVSQYIPSNITKANPNFIVSGGEASLAPMTALQIAEGIDYTLEGTVQKIGEPILFVSSNGDVKASIPITMSVEKIHKGNLNSDTFTFYLTAWAVFVDDIYILKSYSSIGEVAPFLTPHYRDYTISEINNAKNITYGIHHANGQYEIDDKIIIHIAENDHITSAINDGSYVMITDYDLTPYYSTTRGEIDVYKIQSDVIFNYHGIATQSSAILSESQENQ